MTEKIEKYDEEKIQTLDFKYLRRLTKGDFPLASALNLLTESYGKQILDLDLIAIQEALDYIVANKENGEITIVLTLKDKPSSVKLTHKSINEINKTITEMAGN